MKTLGLALIVTFGALQAAPAANSSAAFEQTAAITPAAATLRQDMRKLWTDHVVWTRDYIVAAIGDQPGASAAAARLMRNQDDIGAARPRGQQRREEHRPDGY